MGARVLLLGAGYDSRTSLHLAEYRIPSPRVAVGQPVRTYRGSRWEVVTEVSISSEQSTCGCPVADAAAYAERWLALHRSREEWITDDAPASRHS
jgi:aminoglycoside 3-N-acetyltransferase